MKTPTNKKMLKIKHLCCVIAAVLFSFGAYADQTAWYVKTDGSASADGSSWDNATTLQQAFRLVTAGTVTNWNSIVLEAGTVENPKVYDLSSAETFDESTAFFVVNDKSYVRLTTSAEDLDPRKTVIRGARSTLGEVQCPFMKSSGYFRFEGVTLREFSTVSGYSLCQRVSGSVNATNCVFAANFGTNAVNDTAYGAMFNNPNGTFTGCLFTNNAAWPIKNNDGLVPCSCIAFGDTATTLLKDCRFVDNHGAFMFSQNSYAAIDHDSGGAKSVILNSIVVGNPPYDFNDNVSTKDYAENNENGNQHAGRPGVLPAADTGHQDEGSERALLRLHPDAAGCGAGSRRRGGSLMGAARQGRAAPRPAGGATGEGETHGEAARDRAGRRREGGIAGLRRAARGSRNPPRPPRAGLCPTQAGRETV